MLLRFIFKKVDNVFDRSRYLSVAIFTLLESQKEVYYQCGRDWSYFFVEAALGHHPEGYFRYTYIKPKQNGG